MVESEATRIPGGRRTVGRGDGGSSTTVADLQRSCAAEKFSSPSYPTFGRWRRSVIGVRSGNGVCAMTWRKWRRSYEPQGPQDVLLLTQQSGCCRGTIAGLDRPAGGSKERTDE